MMLIKAATIRAEQHLIRLSADTHYSRLLMQLSVLVGLSHKAETSPALRSLIKEFEKRNSTEDLSKEMNPYELANVRLATKA
ncbi:hypothetical protein BG000_000700 [Podila horticola]|nr:hypothetical protein BG000_000700 [Podila horticola]